MLQKEGILNTINLPSKEAPRPSANIEEKILYLFRSTRLALAIENPRTMAKDHMIFSPDLETFDVVYIVDAF